VSYLERHRIILGAEKDDRKSLNVLVMPDLIRHPEALDSGVRRNDGLSGALDSGVHRNDGLSGALDSGVRRNDGLSGGLDSGVRRNDGLSGGLGSGVRRNDGLSDNHKMVHKP
jgi:hypothetical protein